MHMYMWTNGLLHERRLQFFPTEGDGGTQTAESQVSLPTNVSLTSAVESYEESIKDFSGEFHRIQLLIGFLGALVVLQLPLCTWVYIM